MRFTQGLVVLLVAALVGPGLAGASRTAASPNLSGLVDEDQITFYLQFADGSTVGGLSLPGPVIPPGTYQANIVDNSQVGNFDVEGPGVNLQTGIEQRTTLTWTLPLQPCALYSYRNDSVGPSVHWFQTSASATSTAACPPPLAGTQTGGTAPATTTTTKVKTTKPPPLPLGEVMSAGGVPIRVIPLRGVLNGKLAATGKTALTFHGKSVVVLRPGIYKVSANDSSATKGLRLQRANARKATTISTAAFVGSHDVAVDLTKGQWSFSSTGSGATAIEFKVAG